MPGGATGAILVALPWLSPLLPSAVSVFCIANIEHCGKDC